MAYDEDLAKRIRPLLDESSAVVEKKMFGGLAFLVRGNMAVGIHRNELIVRLSPEEADEAVTERGVRIFDITGRPMRGWVMVSGEVLTERAALARWVQRGVSFASSLPAK